MSRVSDILHNVNASSSFAPSSSEGPRVVGGGRGRGRERWETSQLRRCFERGMTPHVELAAHYLAGGVAAAAATTQRQRGDPRGLLRRMYG